MNVSYYYVTLKPQAYKVSRDCLVSQVKMVVQVQMAIQVLTVDVEGLVGKDSKALWVFKDLPDHRGLQDFKGLRVPRELMSGTSSSVRS
jgi:hypothetical protein